MKPTDNEQKQKQQQKKKKTAKPLWFIIDALYRILVIND